MIYFLNQINAWLQIKTEVNEVPFDALLFVLFLFQHKHVMVEELLQLLISVVDAQLFKWVVLKYLKPSNIQHTNEVGLSLL